MEGGEVSERSTELDGSAPAIRLGQMAQQLEVREPEDDWTGLNDPKERRKLQNRLNQRLWRKRQRVKKTNPESENSSVQKTSASNSHGFENSTSPAIELDGDLEEVATSRKIESGDTTPDPVDPPPFSMSLCKMSPIATQEMLSRFETWAQQSYLLGSPRIDLLLTLIQFNVFRALLSNTLSLGFDMAWLNEDAISPFNTTSPEFLGPSLPENLRPTELQHKVEHHPWIDLFPIPTMRDNLLRAGASYDDTEICMDIVEVGGKPKEKAGLIVWGEPWDIYAWEASPAFLRKWGWVVEGCQELLKSTNYWRMKRGEKVVNL